MVRVVLAVAAAFTLLLAVLTVYVLVASGPDVLTVASLLVLAVLVFGIFGAFPRTPRRDR